MKRLIFLLPVFLLCACRTVRMQTPVITNPPQPRQTLQQKKQAFQDKQKASRQIPEVLGGLVQSDEWVIYKEKEQEEFTGHVSYDNGIYVFKAGYALSDRKQHTVTARQNVYLKQHERKSPTTYEAWGDWAHYNYQTGKGILKSTSKNPAQLRLQDENQTITARAQRIDFDTTAQVFILTGHVDAQRITSEGTQTLQAGKVTFKQPQNYLLLEGEAVLSDGQRTLQADTVLYDGEHNQARAAGKRPLATGTTEQGTFAIIADDVRSDGQGNLVTLSGQVQGWVVSPELNENKVNRQF